ncbi:ubiquitin carboxyl-terminal hydrolase, partial [Plasmodium ovale curtisi]
NNNNNNNNNNNDNSGGKSNKSDDSRGEKGEEKTEGSDGNSEESKNQDNTRRGSNTKEGNSSGDFKRESFVNSGVSYFGPKAKVGSPNILCSSYSTKKGNASKMNSNKSSNPNDNATSAGKNYLAVPQKKNSIGCHSSNGNDVYKSCEEYNIDNGGTSSNGYLTTTETESKGTTENTAKSSHDEKYKDKTFYDIKEKEEVMEKSKKGIKGSTGRRNSSSSSGSSGSSGKSDGSGGSDGGGTQQSRKAEKKRKHISSSRNDEGKEELNKNMNSMKNRMNEEGVRKDVSKGIGSTMSVGNLISMGKSNCSSNRRNPNVSSSGSSFQSSFRSSDSNGNSNGDSNSNSDSNSDSDSSNFSIRNQTISNHNHFRVKENRKGMKHMKNTMAHNSSKRESEAFSNSPNAITTKEQPAGIVNYSMTCYINVVMQCLSVFFKLIYTLHNYATLKYKNFNFSSDDTDHMNTSFMNKNFFTNSIPFNIFGNNNKKKDECLLVTFSYKLFQLNKMHNKRKVLCINKLLNLLNDKYSYLFEYHEQQDCHEFLLLVFDFIHNMMKVIDENVDKNNKIDYYLKKEQSIISDLFLGLIEEKITCSQCEYINYIYQPVYNLSVNVFKKNPDNNLNDNLIEYFKKEEVNSTCEKCKCKKMYKYSYVYKQPNILIIHLIRLLEDGSKIDKPIKFDMMDFSIQNVLKKTNDEYIEIPKKYNLCGVIVHRGLNSNYGHYICYTKRKHSNGVTMWYKFDDSLVTVVDPSEVESSKAYCLFYQSQ